ncbi:MAG: hypothetical protein ACYCTE_06690, partial [Acidimicrobiales bacterium]
MVGKPGTPVSDVAINDNLVEGNDQGNPTGVPITKTSYAECRATPSPPPAPAVRGGCGEGIDLTVVTHSVVADNIVTDNSGGILLTDEVDLVTTVPLAGVIEPRAQR